MRTTDLAVLEKTPCENSFKLKRLTPLIQSSHAQKLSQGINSGQRKTLFCVRMAVTTERGQSHHSTVSSDNIGVWGLGGERASFNGSEMASVKPLVPCHLRACAFDHTDSWTQFQGYGKAHKNESSLPGFEVQPEPD